MLPYKPRDIVYNGILTHRAWRLKQYAIAYEGKRLDDAHVQAGLDQLTRQYLDLEITVERPGVGFVIVHRGRDVAYLVLGYWDNENELPIRLLISDLKAGSSWRTAKSTESFCVWDLQVIWFERNAYIETMLSGRDPKPALEEYLDRAYAKPTV